jgi:hypothetical protein
MRHLLSHQDVSIEQIVWRRKQALTYTKQFTNSDIFDEFLHSLGPSTQAKHQPEGQTQAQENNWFSSTTSMFDYIM